MREKNHISYFYYFLGRIEYYGKVDFKIYELFLRYFKGKSVTHRQPQDTIQPLTAFSHSFTYLLPIHWASAVYWYSRC